MRRATPTLTNFRPVQTGWLGRAIDYLAYQLSPSYGAKRVAQRGMMPAALDRLSARMAGGWPIGASNEDLAKKFTTSGLTTDSELWDQAETVRDRCMAAYKSDPIAHAAVECRVTYEIGSGLQGRGRIRPELGIDQETADQLNAGIEDLVNRWSDARVDRKQIFTLPALQRQVVRSLGIYNEAFIDMRDDPTRNSPLPLICDFIDPRRIETPFDRADDPYCILGVQHDAKGNVTGYWKRRILDGDMLTTGEDGYEFLPKYDKRGFLRVAHMYEAMFPEQTRPWPWLSAVVGRMKDITDFTDAAVLAAQIEACFAGFIKSPHGNLMQEAQAASTSTVNNKELTELEPGRLEYLGPEEEVIFATPQRPGGTLAPFSEYATRQCAAGANLPYELLAKNFFRTTYSSGRLGILDGQRGFNMRRTIPIAMWLDPMWKLLVFEAVFQTDISSLIDLTLYNDRPYVYERHVWKGEGGMSIDPEKETKSHVEAVKNDLDSRTNVLIQKGEDYDDFRQSRYRERANEIEDEVRLRAYRWALEEQNNLPHVENTPEEKEGAMATVETDDDEGIEDDE